MIIAILLLMSFSSCLDDFETTAPQLQNFQVFSLVEEGGQLKKSDPIPMTAIPADSLVRIEVMTDSDIAVFWAGDHGWRPWGTADSVLDSRNYAHYGQLGAEGETTAAVEGQVGWFLDTEWPSSRMPSDPANYTVTVVLTNHGVSGPDFKQEIFEFPVTIIDN